MPSTTLKRIALCDHACRSFHMIALMEHWAACQINQRTRTGKTSIAMTKIYSNVTYLSHWSQKTINLSNLINSAENNSAEHVLGRIKSGKAYLMAKQDQNQRHIMPQNFDFINKPICCKIDVLQAFEAKNSTELFVSN